MNNIESFWLSVRHLFCAVSKRWQWLVPFGLLTIADLYERFFKGPYGLQWDLSIWHLAYAMMGGLLIAAFLAYHELREEHDALISRHTAVLDVVYDPSFNELNYLGLTYRIEVRNRSSVTIKDIRVQLISVMHSGPGLVPNATNLHAGLPFELRQSDDIDPARGRMWMYTMAGRAPPPAPPPLRRTFNLNPEQPQRIDVLIASSVRIGICLANRKENSLPLGAYSLSIMVTGENIPAKNVKCLTTLDADGKVKFDFLSDELD